MPKLDLEPLEKYCFTRLEDRNDAILSIPADDLLDLARLEDFIDEYVPLMHALDRGAAAAALCRWFAGPAIAFQYGLSVWNKAIDVSLSNLTIQLYPVDQYCLFSFKINRWSDLDAPVNEWDRKDWRRRQLERFYENTMRPVIEKLSEVSGVNTGQLWGQLPGKFKYYLNIIAGLTEQKEILDRLKDDYDFLKFGLDAAVFDRKRNPFDVKIRTTESLEEPGKQVPMECTCCLNFRVENAPYCFACPRVKEEEREALRAKFREESQSVNR
ncbi:MAG TPA: IucA/IucC family C-terminal-domain containing protein [Bacillales bacterium]|nr:IucA/IucC family C-terminal-domain containing protein [Bacillales bacterium]